MKIHNGKEGQPVKKTICITLSILLALLCLAGCGKAKQQDNMSIDEFIEKYKRADIETLATDPVSFFDDLVNVENSVRRDNSLTAAFMEWPVEQYAADYESDKLTHREKDVVLFNEAAEINATIMNGNTLLLTISIDRGDPEKDFELCKSIANTLFEKKGDASRISVNNEDADEAALRKAFSKGITDFSVTFTPPDSEFEGLEGEAFLEALSEKYYRYYVSFYYNSYGASTHSTIYLG